MTQNHLADLRHIQEKLQELATSDDKIKLQELVDVMIFAITNIATECHNQPRHPASSAASQPTI